ncbi:MAG: ATP-binding protein, partial [Solirubrobacteraceae bacterium]
MILAATGGLTIVVTVAFVGLLSSTDRLRAASDRRARSEAVIASANATEKLLLDLETGERGFVITDQPRFLQPWLTALKAFPASAARLAALVRDEPAQYRLARAIQSAGAAYVTDWTEPVIAAERRSPARARALVATAGGERRVDAMRAQFKRLVANEQALADTLSSEADHAASVAQVFGVAGLAGSIAVIALFAFLLPRSVLGPFRRLRAAADRIAGGDLSARADADGPREMAALTQSFNAMAQALEHNHAALAHATEVAQNANHAKSEFLARMSHELRTPLNAIIGFSQLLQLDELAPSQSENVGFVLTAGRHLLELINEVLDLARIESGKLAFSPEPVPLAATVRDALALVTPLAQQNDVALHSQADRLAPDLHVRADQHRLKQVLLNLLANAIKYNRPGGWVEISFAVTDGGRVRTRIADNGIGIQPDQLEHLFEPFERLGAELTGVEGTGLGLALSKRLIEVMGGTIDADSQPGSGTTFTIELTTAQLPTGRHEPGPHDQ